MATSRRSLASERPDPLRVLNDELRRMGVDPSLPWLPDLTQPDLFDTLPHAGEPQGETRAPAGTE